MSNNKTNYELMTVDYTENDYGSPGICFCNEFTVIITNVSFVKSFISFVEGELVFKLNFLSGNKLSFKVVVDNEDDPEESVVEVYLDKKPMGYARLGTLTEVMYYIKAQQQKLKEQSE